MKKIITLVLSLIIILSFTTHSFAQAILLNYDGKTRKYTGNIYSLKINDEVINTDVPPVIINNRSMVPVRAVFEKLGAGVKWDEKTQKMNISLNNSNIEFKANDTNARVNNKVIKMDAAAKKINNRLMVPVSFMSAQLNVKVGWFPKESLITIETRGTLQNVECQPENGKDKVVISLDRYKSSNITRATNPDRIIIDLANTNGPEKEKKVETKGNYVNSMRFAQFDGNLTRVVLDVDGQPQYQVEESKNQLVLRLEDPTYKNITYDNSGDRIGFILKDAKLTEGGEELKKLYTGKYDPTGNKYTITFPSSLAELGSGVFKINDSLLNTIEISKDAATKKTNIIFNAKDKFFYEVFTREEVDNTAITIFKPAAKSDKLVVIDPGHGGREPGAIYGGTYEKDLNLDIALRLNALLKSKNIKTYIIREEDSFVGLFERAYIANDLKAKLFLSIHNNAIDDPDYGGTMTLYHPDEPKDKSFSGKRFAQIIQNTLLSKLKTTDRKIIERPKLVVLKATDMPASLAEIAFMTNKKDMGNLKKEAFRQNAAAALCEAVVQALKEVK